MRVLATWLAGLSLLLAACSGFAEEPGAAPTVSGPSSTVAPGTSASDATTSTEPTSTTPAPGRPVAPDFTLELGEGGVYRLSEGARPVYLVFWAEW